MLVRMAVGIIELPLGLRFIFKLLAVNTKTPFVAWLYGITAQLVAPFAKIIPDWRFSGFVIDFTTLAALAVYALIGYFILSIFSSLN